MALPFDSFFKKSCGGSRSYVSAQPLKEPSKSCLSELLASGQALDRSIAGHSVCSASHSSTKDASKNISGGCSLGFSRLSSGLASAFVWRRLHSLSGLFLILFLIEHLVTNSQAALWIGDDGKGFIRAVNFIQGLPYLPLIELSLIGLPLFLHLVIGVKYLLQAAPNSFYRGAEKPYMNFAASQAYTWQRISAWVLLFLIFAHLIHMRVLHDPEPTARAHKESYLTLISEDSGIATLADRLDVELYDRNQIESYCLEAKAKLEEQEKAPEPPSERGQSKEVGLERDQREFHFAQEMQNLMASTALEAKQGELSIHSRSIIAVCPDAGTSLLLTLRDVFKNPWICIIYSLLVLGTVYHASNGLWTSLITWGIAATAYSQLLARRLSLVLMTSLAFLGLSAIWLSYWVNLLR